MSDSRDVSPQLMAGLGLIVSRWAYVEALEGEFLSFLTDADPGSMYTITQSVSGATLTDWLRTLSQVRFSSANMVANLGKLFTNIDETRADRNALVHGLWKPGPEDGTAIVQTIRWDRREVVREELVTAADIDELVERIIDINRELLMLGNSLGFGNKPRG
jgi:hypothetical protein